jgi:hypothetical protein
MNNGVLIFAQNGNFDYVKLAELSALRVKEYLDLPVSLVTNIKYQNKDSVFDKIINIKSKQSQIRNIHDGNNSNRVKWLNFDRHLSYELSPYDKTLVIDADYLVSSNNLMYCFESNKEFLIYNKDYYFIENVFEKNFKYINEFGIPFYWATVFYFTKTEKNKLFFKFIEYIKDNWDYYRVLYSIIDSKFRNDFAFSIAINLLHNQLSNKEFGFIPGKLFYTIDKDSLIMNESETMGFYLHNNSCVKTKGLDVHVMNKKSIVRVLNE